MRNREDSDASFLVGLVLGVVVGAAVVFIVASSTAENNRPILGRRAGVARLENKIDEAEERVEGASEGAAS